RHLLVRGFDKVRGEWSLMALCYNFTRVLNILGFERFVACVATALSSRQNLLAAIRHLLQRATELFWAQIAQLLSIRQPQLVSQT
ncbi:MAG: hypothetical protein ACXWKG_20130, partial [Limisphaerales bacterium]